MKPEDLFLAELETIEGVISFVCRRHALSADEGEEFRSHVLERLIDEDYRVLRRFEGKSRLDTYLSVVVQNLFRDFRIARWGKWRASAKASRLGELALQLEALLYRDRHTLDEASEILITNFQVEASRREIAELAAELPERQPRRFEAADELAQLPADDRADRRARDRELSQQARQIEEALGEALSELPAEDRLILQLRFQEGFRVSEIARTLGLEQRPLYPRLGRALRQLREHLESRGLDPRALAETLSWDGLTLEVDYRIEKAQPRSV